MKSRPLLLGCVSRRGVRTPRPSRAEFGFSLVEVLVGIALVTISSLALVGVATQTAAWNFHLREQVVRVESAQQILAKSYSLQFDRLTVSSSDLENAKNEKVIQAFEENAIIQTAITSNAGLKPLEVVRTERGEHTQFLLPVCYSWVEGPSDSCDLSQGKLLISVTTWDSPGKTCELLNPRTERIIRADADTTLRNTECFMSLSYRSDSEPVR